MKIAVTGAGGWLGGAVCTEIGTRGIGQSICIDRPGCPSITHHWDCLENNAVERLAEHLQGSDVLIHCAGYAHRPVETAREKKLFWAINQGGTNVAVRACKKADVGRILYVGTIAAYDWSKGGIKSETSDLRPLTEYAKSKLAGEEIVAKSGLDWCVTRLATLFGSGDRANFSRLAHALKRRRFILRWHFRRRE